MRNKCSRIEINGHVLRLDSIIYLSIQKEHRFYKLTTTDKKSFIEMKNFVERTVGIYKSSKKKKEVIIDTKNLKTLILDACYN